jgi:hypothetical protein
MLLGNKRGITQIEWDNPGNLSERAVLGNPAGEWKT